MMGNMEDTKYKELKAAIIWANEVIDHNYPNDIYEMLMKLDTDGNFYKHSDYVEILREIFREI